MESSEQNLFNKDSGIPASTRCGENPPHWIDRIKTSKKYENVAEKQIWEDFKKNDEAAFIHIYIKYYGELINFGLQFTSDRTIIEDIIQNLFIHLRDKRKTLPKLRSSIRLFLFQCLKRKFFDHRKATRYILPGKLDAAFEIVLAEDTKMIMDQSHQDRIERLKLSIEKLNERQREIIYYYYYKNLSYEEIKTLMGFSNVKSARNFVYKTISILKKLVLILLLALSSSL